MPPDVLVSAGLQYGGKIIDMASQNYRDKRNHRWDVEAATTAYDRQRQLLADQRAYESPAAQMRRYIEAGLNPNLIYGQQQGSIAPPTVPQGSNSVGTTQTSFGDVNLMQTELMQAQIDRLKTQNDNDIKMTDAQIERWAKENGVSDAQAKELLASVYKINEETRNLGKQWILMDKMEQLRNYEIQIKQQSWQDEVRKIAAGADISAAEAKYASAYFLARLEYVQAGRDDLLSSKALKDSQKALNDQQKAYMDRIIDDLVEIVKSQRSQSECAAAISTFMKNHTNNWEYWLKNGIQILSQLAMAYGQIKTPVSFGTYSVPNTPSSSSSW